jgi:hypothetical protein
LPKALKILFYLVNPVKVFFYFNNFQSQFPTFQTLPKSTLPKKKSLGLTPHKKKTTKQQKSKKEGYALEKRVKA